MDETEREQRYEDDGDDDDDGSYANAYLNDDENEDEDDEDDLAAMFAKVKTIQQIEGIQPSSSATTSSTTSQAKVKAPPSLDVKIIQATAAQKTSTSSRASGSTPTSARRSKSPSSGVGGGVVSEDGIKTISRRTLSSSGAAAAGKGPIVRIDALLNVKKPAIYEDKLLQSVKSSDLLEKLKMKTAQAAPGTQCTLASSDTVYGLSTMLLCC